MIHNTIKISLIAAITKDRALGKDNELLFKIPEDLKRFREITSGRPIIMGRKTFESIGRPLPNRLNIIVSRKSGITVKDCSVTVSLEDALELAKKYELDKYHKNKNHIPEIFIIGGGQIFEQAIKFADKLYLTVIEGKFDADTYFPDYSDFKKVVFEQEFASVDHKGKFLELERK